MKTLFFLFLSLSIFVIYSCRNNRGSNIDANHYVQVNTLAVHAYNQVYFTDPNEISKGSKDPKIITTLVNLIESAKEESEIYLSIFLIDHPDVINSLKHAVEKKKIKLYLNVDATPGTSSWSSNCNEYKCCNDLECSYRYTENCKKISNTCVESGKTVSCVKPRNMRFRDIFLELQNNSENTINLILFNAKTNDPNKWPGKGKNHNKFALFSKVNLNQSEVRNVVFLTSQNLTCTSSKKYQDAIVVSDREIYTGLVNYMNTMSRGNFNDHEYTILDGIDNTRAYLFPRKSGDTFLSVLKNIKNKATVDVKIACGRIYKDRLELSNNAILKELESIVKAGGSVTIITNYENISSSYLSDDLDETLDVIMTDSIAVNIEDKVDIASKQQKNGIQLLKQNLCKSNYPFKLHLVQKNNNIHSKYFMINGEYGKKSGRRKLVWVGSHNLTKPALRYNGEVIMKFENNAVYEAYESNFADIQKFEDCNVCVEKCE